MATPQEEDRRVQEIVRELQGATLGGNALVAVLPKLRRLLEAEKVAAYKPVRRPAKGFTLDFLFAEGFPAGAEKTIADWYSNAPHAAIGFDPEAPDEAQRNVVIRGFLHPNPEQMAAFTQLYPMFGLDKLHQIRVLVCDGPHLRAWVGAWRGKPFTEDDARRFAALVPAMQSRLQLEASLLR